MRENIHITDSDGVVLNVYAGAPKEEPIGMIQIAHGMTENLLRYDAFANYMTERGYLVYGNDHRGHGGTASQKSDLGYLADQDGFEWLVKDVYEQMQHMKRLHPKFPVILFGHSLGSLVAQRFID